MTRRRRVQPPSKLSHYPRAAVIRVQPLSAGVQGRQKARPDAFSLLLYKFLIGICPERNRGDSRDTTPLRDLLFIMEILIVEYPAGDPQPLCPAGSGG